MASSYRMLIAGIGALAFTFALGIYVIIFGTMFSTIIPLFQSMTPPYWWNALGGNNIPWIVAMVWALILLSEALVVVYLWYTAGDVTVVDKGW